MLEYLAPLSNDRCRNVKSRHDRQLAIIVLVAVLILVLPGASVPPGGILLGVAANPLADGQNVDLALTQFELDADRPVDIVHYYKLGQDKAFPRDSELARALDRDSPRILFYNWKPAGLTWREVADGAADNYLRQTGRNLAQGLPGQFFLSVNAEMEDEVNPTSDSGQTAADFRDFFRHVILLLRASAGENLVSVMGYTGTYKWSKEPWFGELYPGDDVVDWIAQDPFAVDPRTTPDIAHLVNAPADGWPGFYDWALAEFPSKPQMLAEWGVADSQTTPNYKPEFFELAAEALKEFPRIRALVYWNHKGQRDDGEHLKVGTTAVNSNPATLDAFRSFVHSDIFLPPKKYVEHPP